MKILALDTATFVASVAVWSDGDVRAEGDARASTHSEKLLPLVDDMLARAGLRPADLDAIACGAGPGSFTGLRIGLSTAKGLCFALGRPLVLVSSLAALALDARGPEGAIVLALLDAKKHELYAGLYEADARHPITAEVVIPPARLAEHVLAAAAGRRVVVVGDGAAAYPEVAARCGEILDERRATPGAGALARLAAARLAGGERDEILTAAPTYIRASEAEIATPPKPVFPSRK
jgi:tRNA threonylcarbamoyladenosine biosynthesis protein TsaB